MQYKKTALSFLFVGMAIVLATGIWLATASTANAQCGSQASSCKNCHEVQGQMSVNNDGTGWHQSHAFGDFCYICHAGNQQATDKAAAHTGMVPPFSDVKASCQQCHPKDLDARAQVYAAKLGITVGTDTETTGAAASPTAPAAAANQAPAASNIAAPASIALVVDDSNVVDYVQRYNELVLGQHPTNWGNVFLMVMIALVLVGGGGFVILKEKLVNVSFGETKKVGDDYPADVVDMLPEISKLKAKTRKSLKRVLDNPKKADKVLGLMDAIVSDEETEE